jgi:hypothetical protein
MGMKKLLWVSSLVLLVAGPALADAVYHPPQVTGKRERKNIRHFLYVKNLTGDKKDIYDRYGYTSHRVRLNEYGKVYEKWTYYEVGMSFTFDQCGSLVDSEGVDRELRRTWAYQRDVAGYDEAVCCDD